MEEQSQDGNNSPSQHGPDRSSAEPVRSRWTPKPEQILILESIFNSGMVNPPKDETVRIRKLLEKFGSVGDANVFYWFQNRRSRSRRRQRQLQASLIAAAGEQRNNHHHQAQQASSVAAGATIQYDSNNNNNNNNSNNCVQAATAVGLLASTPCTNFLVGSSSSCGIMCDDGVETLYPMSGQMGFQELHQNSSVTSMLCPSDSSNLQYQTGFITVFINGVPTEIPRGPIDMKTLFGQDVILVHSSGLPVPTNEFGLLMQSLQHGESYFLVSKSA